MDGCFKKRLEILLESIYYRGVKEWKMYVFFLRLVYYCYIKIYVKIKKKFLSKL